MDPGGDRRSGPEGVDVSQKLGETILLVADEGVVGGVSNLNVDRRNGVSSAQGVRVLLELLHRETPGPGDSHGSAPPHGGPELVGSRHPGDGCWDALEVENIRVTSHVGQQPVSELAGVGHAEVGKKLLAGRMHGGFNVEHF